MRNFEPVSCWEWGLERDSGQIIKDLDILLKEKAGDPLTYRRPNY